MKTILAILALSTITAEASAQYWDTVRTHPKSVYGRQQYEEHLHRHEMTNPVYQPMYGSFSPPSYYRYGVSGQATTSRSTWRSQYRYPSRPGGSYISVRSRYWPGYGWVY